MKKIEFKYGSPRIFSNGILYADGKSEVLIDKNDVFHISGKDVIFLREYFKNNIKKSFWIKCESKLTPSYSCETNVYFGSKDESISKLTNMVNKLNNKIENYNNSNWFVKLFKRKI